jgi:hypothetical protein
MGMDKRKRFGSISSFRQGEAFKAAIKSAPVRLSSAVAVTFSSRASRAF